MGMIMSLPVNIPGSGTHMRRIQDAPPAQKGPPDRWIVSGRDTLKRISQPDFNKIWRIRLPSILQETQTRKIACRSNKTEAAGSQVRRPSE